MLFKDFFIFNFGGHSVWWSRTIGAILVEGVMMNISVKLFCIWISDSGAVV